MNLPPADPNLAMQVVPPEPEPPAQLFHIEVKGRFSPTIQIRMEDGAVFTLKALPGQENSRAAFNAWVTKIQNSAEMQNAIVNNISNAKVLRFQTSGDTTTVQSGEVRPGYEAGYKKMVDEAKSVSLMRLFRDKPDITPYLNWTTLATVQDPAAHGGGRAHAAPLAAPHAGPPPAAHAAPPPVAPHGAPPTAAHGAPPPAPHVDPLAAPHVDPLAAPHVDPLAAPHVDPLAAPHVPPTAHDDNVSEWGEDDNAGGRYRADSEESFLGSLGGGAYSDLSLEGGRKREETAVPFDKAFAASQATATSPPSTPATMMFRAVKQPADSPSSPSSNTPSSSSSTPSSSSSTPSSSSSTPSSSPMIVDDLDREDADARIAGQAEAEHLEKAKLTSDPTAAQARHAATEAGATTTSSSSTTPLAAAFKVTALPDPNSASSSTTQAKPPPPQTKPSVTASASPVTPVSPISQEAPQGVNSLNFTVSRNEPPVASPPPPAKNPRKSSKSPPPKSAASSSPPPASGASTTQTATFTSKKVSLAKDPSPTGRSVFRRNKSPPPSPSLSAAEREAAYGEAIKAAFTPKPSSSASSSSSSQASSSSTSHAPPHKEPAVEVSRDRGISEPPVFGSSAPLPSSSSSSTPSTSSSSSPSTGAHTSKPVLTTTEKLEQLEKARRKAEEAEEVDDAFDFELPSARQARLKREEESAKRTGTPPPSGT